jgi:hypothetical protein
MAKRYVYDYYEVDVPGDLSDDMTVLAEQAITEARERTKLYCMPALWTATRISGEIGDYEVRFRVVRKRNRRVA